MPFPISTVTMLATDAAGSIAGSSPDRSNGLAAWSKFASRRCMLARYQKPPFPTASCWPGTMAV
jgi:hypothetical protein